MCTCVIMVVASTPFYWSLSSLYLRACIFIFIFIIYFLAITWIETHIYLLSYFSFLFISMPHDILVHRWIIFVSWSNLMAWTKGMLLRTFTVEMTFICGCACPWSWVFLDKDQQGLTNLTSNASNICGNFLNEDAHIWL